MDGNAMVLVTAASADVVPATLLLLQIQTSGVRKEQPGENHASETKPWNNVELGLGVDVVVQNRSQQSA